MGKISDYERQRLTSAVVDPGRRTEGADLAGVARETGQFADTLNRIGNEDLAAKKEAARIAAAAAQAKAKADAEEAAMRFEAENLTIIADRASKEFVGKNLTAEDNAAVSVLNQGHDAAEKVASQFDPLTAAAFREAVRPRLSAFSKQAGEKQIATEKARRKLAADQTVSLSVSKPSSNAYDLSLNIAGTYMTGQQLMGAQPDGGVAVSKNLEKAAGAHIEQYLYANDYNTAASRAVEIQSPEFMARVLSGVPETYRAQAAKDIEGLRAQASSLLADKDRMSVARQAQSQVMQDMDPVYRQTMFDFVQQAAASGRTNPEYASQLSKTGFVPGDEYTGTPLQSVSTALMALNNDSDRRELIYRVLPTTLQLQGYAPAKIESILKSAQREYNYTRTPSRTHDTVSDPDVRTSVADAVTALEAATKYTSPTPAKGGKMAVPAAVSKNTSAELFDPNSKTYAAMSNAVKSLDMSLTNGTLSTGDYMAGMARVQGIVAAASQGIFDRQASPVTKALLPSAKDPYGTEALTTTVKKLTAELPPAIRASVAGDLYTEGMRYQMARNAYAGNTPQDAAKTGWAEKAARFAASVAFVGNPVATVALGAFEAAGGSAQRKADRAQALATLSELESVLSPIVVTHKLAEYKPQLDGANRAFIEANGKRAFLSKNQNPGQAPMLTMNPENAETFDPSVWRSIRARYTPKSEQPQDAQTEDMQDYPGEEQ